MALFRLVLTLGLILWASSTTFAQQPEGPPPIPGANPGTPDLPVTIDPPADASKSEPPPAAEAPPPAADTVGITRSGVLRLVTQANPMLWPLALCSIAALGFSLERLIALRRGRVIPKDFVNRFMERLSSGKLDKDRAAELCRSNSSPAARVFGHVVRYWGQPAATIRQGVSHDAAGEVVDLKRNVRVLNGTATLAPLLGLLGTVIGLIESFNALGGRVGTAKGEALAHGISLALVATAVGLGIAIVSIVAYYYLLNRVDILVRELDDQARRVIDLVSAEASRPVAMAVPMPMPHADRRAADLPRSERQESRAH